MTVCLERANVDRHFEGTIAPADERAMREHLPACAACRQHYQRWLVLSKLDPEALPARDRIARGLGLGRQPALGVGRIVRLVPLAALVAAAALVLWIRAAPSSDGFAARGSAHASPASHVFVYDVRPGELPAPASGSVARHEELAFAYENGAAKKRVMIFGVDEHRHVYWFYPAWTNAADNPVAVPIETDARRHELPEAVRHDLDGTRLEVRALFVDGPVSVREVEAAVLAQPVGPLPIAGAVEDRASFSLSP